MRFTATAIVAMATAIAPVSFASATIVFSSGDVDLDIHLHEHDGETELELGFHDEANDLEIDASEGLVFVPEAGSGGIALRPADAAYSFIGVGAGEPYYVLPEVEDPAKVYFGIGTEEIAPGTLDAYVSLDPRVPAVSTPWVNLILADVRGPGVFSLWNQGDEGPILWMTSADGIGATDQLLVPEDSHTHYNWSFSAPGVYEIDFVAAASLGGELIVSDTTTYRFVVVPETSMLAPMALGAVALLRRRK